MQGSEPLLFIPGAFTDERLYAHQLDHLHDTADARFVALPDLTDAGAMADAILSDAPERFGVVGLSLGAIVALEMLRRAPQRLTRLALLATSAEPDPPHLRTIRQGSIERVRAGGLEQQVEMITPLLLSPTSREDPEITALTRSMALATDPERYARQVEAVMTRPDARPLLPNITCPTLVLCGRDDAITSWQSHETLAATIPHARLAIIEKAGHLLTIEQPQAATAALREWIGDAGE